MDPQDCIISRDLTSKERSRGPPHLAHVCRCVDVHDADQMEEHDVTVRIKDGLYFRLAATSYSPVLQQEVRASGELVDVNTLKGKNRKISGVK